MNKEIVDSQLKATGSNENKPRNPHLFTKEIVEIFLNHCASNYTQNKIVKKFNLADLASLSKEIMGHRRTVGYDLIDRCLFVNSSMPLPENEKNKYVMKIQRKIIKKLISFKKIQCQLSIDFQNSKIISLENSEITTANEVYPTMQDQNGQKYYARLMETTNQIILPEARIYILRHSCILPLIGWIKKETQNEPNEIYYIYHYIDDTLDSYLGRKEIDAHGFDPKCLVKKLLYGMEYLQDKGLHYHSNIIFMDGDQPAFGYILVDDSEIAENRLNEYQVNDMRNLANILRKIDQKFSDQKIKIVIEAIENAPLIRASVLQSILTD